MKYLTCCIGIALLSFTNAASTENKRQLGLFNVVSFDNQQCSSSDTRATAGTCYSAEECTNKGGTANGNCAAGFGVCCVFTENTCGSTIDMSKNLTYFRNPGFPSAFTATTPNPCVVTMTYDSSICQIRLDFETLVLTEPIAANNGACGGTIDELTIANSPAMASYPGPGGLCGDGLTGQHIYIETSRAGSVTWSLALGTTASTTRMWNIRTTFLECDNDSLAPEGCAQYFTGANGIISNYNQAGGQIIADQIFRTCIRQESGYCAIAYSAPGSTDFALAAAVTATSQNNAIATDCANSAVLIPLHEPSVGGSAAMPPARGFCGGKFSLGALSSLSGVITSRVTPFEVGFRSFSNTALTGLAGYRLTYNQVPCA